VTSRNRVKSVASASTLLLSPGRPKSRNGRDGIADFDIDPEIARNLRPKLRSAGLQRIRRLHDRWQLGSVRARSRVAAARAVEQSAASKRRQKGSAIVEVTRSIPVVSTNSINGLAGSG